VSGSCELRDEPLLSVKEVSFKLAEQLILSQEGSSGTVSHVTLQLESVE
jgi:hypothetical protein